ncbi:uncharacterized protein N7496_001832 [Penicillium cataractarum]|uniref:Uncharacterized protein n=1 Tax=Penicillium cataractarum TaxID=2100454 RepID=A0A9W9VX58_9EURO|nr:uncharacterized protein N7496_001832 [Penicillium cataractarum]KAJ5390764.1 hypothetical protein N7496_001832 [Penicillium cataractarum]
MAHVNNVSPPGESSSWIVEDEEVNLSEQEIIALYCRTGPFSLTGTEPPGNFNEEERERVTQSNRISIPEEPVPTAFEEFQAAGSVRQTWIENPSVPCPITRSELTVQHLLDLGWSIQDREPYLDWFEVNEIRGLDVPQDPEDPTGRLEDFDYRFEEWSGQGAKWIGWTGPRLLVVSDIERTLDSTSPPIAEVTKIVYERAFDIDGLKYVFFQNVVNKQTQAFIKRLLYTTERLGYTWYDRPGDHRVWERNSPEYQALLGTRIGKIVLYLILASYLRGSRRITRIVTYHIAGSMTVNIRFDIETLGRSSRRRKCLSCLQGGRGGCYIL